jgi:hypothetical protein
VVSNNTTPNVTIYIYRYPSPHTQRPRPARHPQLLFRTPAAWFSEADATSDGSRFLVAIPVEQTTSQPFTVVLNWQAELAAKNDPPRGLAPQTAL